MEEELDNLDRSRRTYLAQMRTLIARQLSEVEASDSQVVASTLRGAGSNSSGLNRNDRSPPRAGRRGESEKGRRFRLLPTDRSPDELEKEMLSRWKEEKLFQQTLAQAEGKPEFVFFEGPPTANGRPGIHHVFSRTVKDLFCRYRAMSGNHVAPQSGLGHPRASRRDRSGKGIETDFGIRARSSRSRRSASSGSTQMCRESVWRYAATGSS